jgi:hypothetical protein
MLLCITISCACQFLYTCCQILSWFIITVIMLNSFLFTLLIKVLIFTVTTLQFITFTV